MQQVVKVIEENREVGLRSCKWCIRCKLAPLAVLTRAPLEPVQVSVVQNGANKSTDRTYTFDKVSALGAVSHWPFGAPLSHDAGVLAGRVHRSSGPQSPKRSCTTTQSRQSSRRWARLPASPHYRLFLSLLSRSASCLSAQS